MKKSPGTFFLLLFIFAGCVGTIEDTELKKTKTVPTDPPPISFDGIYSATPIAHDKVDIAFFPAPGDAEQLTYMINYDGLTTPVTVPGSSLRPDYRGLLIYTVIGLGTNEKYNFEVQVKNIKTTARSNANAQKAATTFANVTANFLGIQSVSVMPGLAGINSIKVKWAEAEKQGSNFVPKDIDPNKYLVTIINGDVLSPGDMNNEAFSEPLRKVVYVAPDKISSVVGGLLADTNYYVSVRTIHHGYTLYGSDFTYKKEVNSKYLAITTLKAGLSNIDFDLESLNMALSPGAQGLTSMTAQWTDAIGAFDHYRVYYAESPYNLPGYVNPDPICDGQETNDPAVYCKQVHYLTTGTTLVDLNPNVEYSVALGVCQSLDCAPSTRILSSQRQIKTTPNTALYAGVTTILSARTYNKLDELYLQVQPPDLGTGIMDGVLVKFYDILGNVFYLNHPTVPNLSELSTLAFNFTSATEIAMTGINPFSVDAYCFSAVPFTWVLGVVVEHSENEVIQCKIPTINAPTLAEFPGLNSCSSSAGLITVAWSVPLQGIYSNYEIFVRDISGPFDFGQAVIGNVAYTRHLASESVTEFTIDSLPMGSSWRIGMVTYVNVNGVKLRSEFNAQTCDVLVQP